MCDAGQPGWLGSRHDSGELCMESHDCQSEELMTMTMTMMVFFLFFAARCWHGDVIAIAPRQISGRVDKPDKSAIESFLFPDKKELPNDVEMPIWDHLEELRERALLGVSLVGLGMLGCFCFSKELVLFLEAPVAANGVRFLQLSPGEFFFTTLKVSDGFRRRIWWDKE